MEENKKVKCCRCKNIHLHSERIKKQDKKQTYLTNLVCPRCGAFSYYNLNEKG